MASTNLQNVITKFTAFVLEAEKLRAELHAAQEQVTILKNEITAKNAEIAQLQVNLSNRNIAEAVVGHNGNEVNEAKQKITELMREIDRCIALLNV